MSKKYLDSAGLNKFAAMILSKFAAKNHSHSNATTNSAGFMSANDKVKLDGVAAGANKTIVDSTLSSTSVNAIQNKAVKTALDGKAASSHTHSTAQITGLDSALASKAPVSHNHSADNITSGVLPIGRGGTGANNATGAVRSFFPKTGNLGFVATIGNDWSGGYRANADLANDLYPTIKAKTDPVTTSGTGAAYTATVPCITSLATGATFTMIPHTTSTSTSPTLNVNGLGAKNIRQRLSGSSSATTVGASASWLIAGKAVQVAYDGTFWVVDFTRPDLSNAYGTLPVSKGGTGATNAGTARTNLGINTINLYNNENNTSGRISSTSLLEFTDSKIDYLIVTVKYSTPSLNSTSSSTFIVPHCQFRKRVSFMVAGDHSNCPMIGVLFGAFSGSDFYPSAQKQYNGSILSQISNYIAIINVDAVLNQPL